MNLRRRSSSTPLAIGLSFALAIWLLLFSTPPCYSDIITGVLDFGESGATADTPTTQPTGALQKSNTGVLTNTSTGYTVSDSSPPGQLDIITKSMTSGQQAIVITLGYHRTGFAPTATNGILNISGTGLSILEQGGSFPWTMSVTGDIEHSGGSSNDSIVGTINTNFTGSGSKSPVAWNATSSSIAVIGGQNYDVEYTIMMTLRSVPAGATYTFDPPDGGRILRYQLQRRAGAVELCAAGARRANAVCLWRLAAKAF
jgi:hypothetical protein